MRILLIRHGQTVWNRERRLQGRADSPLTLQGARLAVAYGSHLAEILGDLTNVGFFVSPMGRTRQTASLMADRLGIDPSVFEVDPLLAEHDVGAFEALTWPEIEAKHRLDREVWLDWTYRPPGGESRVEVRERAKSWLEGPRTRDTVVLVTHGGFSRAFRAEYLGLDPLSGDELSRHEHGRFFELEQGQCVEHIIEDVPVDGDSPLS